MKRFFTLVLIASGIVLLGSCLKTRTENIAFFNSHLQPSDTSTALWINEFCARGSTYLVDELNPASDHWIELYNKTSSPINFDSTNYYMTGDSTINTVAGGMYKLTKFTIPAHSWLVLFADDSNQVTATHIHANFHISKEGGFIGLYSYNPGTTVLTKMNTISYDTVATSGSSMGVYPDGAPNWNTYIVPSPDASNAHP